MGMKKAIMALFVMAILAMSVSVVLADKPTDFDNNGNALAHVSDTGFDEFGYNWVARIFSGTGWSWCMAKVGDEAWCTAYLGPYANDRIVMKWNAEWDRGNDEGWTDPNGYAGAWTDNEWNGMKDGSGSVWHYKIVWDEGCATSGVPSTDGGYCIWGQFVTLMDQGTDGGQHIWLAHALPTGYGN